VLDVHVQVDPPARDAVVPTMSLQPLAENAIRHGVRRRERGTITIRAVAAGDHVELSVTDDGAGFAPQRGGLSRTAAGGGIGLANVDARLRATFGQQFGLRVRSAPGIGTTVSMTIPAADAATLGIAA